MNRLRLIKTAYTALAALMLAACASDELTDGTVQDLPEGMYPLQISSVTMSAESTAEPWGANAPQSRVAENDERTGSVWQDCDKIKVQIGNGTPGTYTYQNGNLTVADGDAPAYWASKANNQTIRAWYTSSDNETVNLSNQTNGLAYVVTTQTTANFNESVSLTFSHALAKVRVTLKAGEAANFVDNVSIKSYTTCALSQGTLGSGANEGEIKMYKVTDNIFEANVYPGYQIKEVMANNVKWSTLSTPVTPEATKIHKIEITVNGSVETITLSSQGDEYTVESGKSIIINGGANSLAKRIIIKEDAKVMLKDVILAAPANGKNTIEIQGNATLLLSGANNNITGSNLCPLAVTKGTLTINGTDNDKLRLTGGKSGDAGCLGINSGANLIINGGHIVADGSKTEGAGIGSYWAGGERCGTITINSGIINASGGESAAGIGSGRQCGCGDIIITGGNITATGGERDQGGYKMGGAGIGSGEYSPNTGSQNGYCGDITISGKNTVVVATAGCSNCDDIGVGYSGKCGVVTITDANVTATNKKIHGH